MKPNYKWLWRLVLLAAVAALAATGGFVHSAKAFDPEGIESPADEGFLEIPDAGAPAPGDNGNFSTASHDNGRGGNTFTNDPCLDPPPTAPPPENRRRTVQSETEVAVNGSNVVVGYNDSFGFYDNQQGLSGFAFSTNGGNTFIDGGGLPPLIRGVRPFPLPVDRYLGDPVVQVDQSTGEFYFASIYQLPNGTDSISVNKGVFTDAPPNVNGAIESVSNTRCLNQPELTGIPDPPSQGQKQRIVWGHPVVAVPVTASTRRDFLDKEWMTVDQKTGQIYVTYTRFAADGSTPLEVVRSDDHGATWKGPFVIIPNLADTFNQATQPIVTSTGRVVVTWIARTFSLGGFGPESENRIEAAYSDNQGVTFSSPVVVAKVNPQGEPPGYNRNRRSILNAPYIAADPTSPNVYIGYFNGKTPLVGPGGVIFTGPIASQGDILLSTSATNGTTYGPPVKVNDDPGTTSHVFPTVQVNKHHDVYMSWNDRRADPNNELTNTWANVSKDGGATFGHDKLQSDIGTSWRVRADARPNFGDYNSSDLIGDNQFVITWADGRFRPPGGQAATPDTIFTIANGLGVGNG